jgi:hypothetical protein
MLIHGVDFSKGAKIEIEGVHTENYDNHDYVALIYSLHHEVTEQAHTIEGKNMVIEQLNADRLPLKIVTDPLGKVSYDKLPVSTLAEDITRSLILPPSLYAKLKAHLMLAMRDKHPKIEFELKGNEIIEIL